MSNLGLIQDEVDENAKGKNSEALRKSRESHARLKMLFGGTMPESIMLHDKRDMALDLMADARGYSKTEKPRLSGTRFRVSGTGCGAGALSRFPQNVGRTLLLLYTKPGDVVVDPFAGHNSRMELCITNGRRYIGQDISRKFMAANRAILKILQSRRTLVNGVSDCTLFEGDSRKMQAPDACGDFTITSPPYWNIEEYGDEPGQLGKLTYKEFLEGLYQVMRENFRCLKPGAFCVWCVNDFRRNGKFYPYHEHTARGLRKAGFVQWDIAITDLGSSMGACFPNQIMERKILPKRHEYALIFRKPE